ncbi:MAG TPA: S8 family serine peptidase [Verrucomicrobiae bacterium]
MKPSICKAIALTGIFYFIPAAQAQFASQIGLTLLRETTTNLNGSGIRVAQPEAYDLGTTNWEVNPSAVGQPVTLFKYFSSGGTSTSYPNTLSGASGHAAGVGQNFYGIPSGVSTNVEHMDNLDANYFYGNYVAMFSLPSIGDAIVNQSFTFGPQTISIQQSIDTQYDNYSVKNKTLFISAANNYGNSANVCAPGTSYNCISVGAYQNGSFGNSLGPTPDNGRCKPDITALSGETSFSTPQVAGAAALLMQAALRGDGGGDTNSASDMRMIKALLLNGAVKPGGWTNSNSSPLDARYGAGVLNVFNSYQQLAGGKCGYIISTTVASGGAHPPTGDAGTVSSLNGWDFNTNTSVSVPLAEDAVNHYYFNATNGPGNVIATATLVWNRQENQTGINNLDLFLYNCASSNLVTCSTSRVDNVEHIFTPNLPPGRYDLQVWKAGGLGIVSAAEPYALAFSFTSPTLALAKSGTNLNLSWPVYPAGFLAEASTNLTSGTWSTNNLPEPIITNGQNVIWLNATNASQFFRLRMPNL